MTVTNDDIIKAEMNDKELADRVVALGVGKHVVYEVHGIIEYKLVFGESIEAKNFVRDWRVAGRLMERVFDGAPVLQDVLNAAIRDNKTYAGFCLPRAIIEACVEALSK